MSALDDLVTYNGGLTEEEHAEARAELVLLREASKVTWEWIEWASHDTNFGQFPNGQMVCWQCGLNASIMKHDDDCFVLRILRTDPDRARKMGLAWAL